MRYLAGIDIGGTKCAVTLGKETSNGIDILEKKKFPTPSEPREAVNALIDSLKEILSNNPQAELSGIGISCGGPLDSKKGLILCPPNLPNWDKINVVEPFENAFGVPAAVQNDANACALAEWTWGAGRGTKNMIFLTFGTGLGAGLILDGKLYTGTSDMAGEVGHVRLREDGPTGYGKAGSFEGFCSGGGIARYGRMRLRDWLSEGRSSLILSSGMTADEVTAQDIGAAAGQGDELALSILEHTGKMLGVGISMLLDILNPEMIVIGSIFLRQEALLRKPMEEIIAQEALSHTRSVCRIVPAGLWESLGDYAALSVAAGINSMV